MYPIVEIECTNHGVKQKAEVMEYSPEALRVAIVNTEIALNLRKEGNVYVGRQSGLEFVVSASYDDIDAMKNPRPTR